MNAQYWRGERTRMQKMANDYDPIRSHPDLTAIERKIETVGKQMKHTHRGDPEYLQHDQHIRSLSDQWRTRYQELNDAHAQAHAPQAAAVPDIPKPGMSRGKMGLIGAGVGLAGLGAGALWHHHQQEKIAALNFDEFPGHPRQKELEHSYRQWQEAAAQAGRLTPEHPDYAAASNRLDELSRQHENLYRDVQNDWLHGHFPNDEPNPQTPPWAKRGIKGRLGVLAGGLGLAGAGAAWAAHRRHDNTNVN